MARVCLIPLGLDPTPRHCDRLNSYRTRLEAAGYQVNVEREDLDPSSPDRPHGLVKRALGQIRSASGTYLIVFDTRMAYTPDDVLRVVERLETGATSLVVATRSGRWFSTIARRLTGTSDPSSGLVGLTRGAARSAEASFAPTGSRFVCELLARVEGERAEVMVKPVAGPGRRWLLLDDIRHAKRIADHRLGNLSRLLQFCFVGASGMVIDLTTYAALQAILSQTPLGGQMLFTMRSGGGSTSLAVVLAAVLAIAMAMTWNFSLNRRLTFNDARSGSIIRQYLRYALSNLVGIGISLAFRLLLPGSVAFFSRHRLAAAVAGIIAATGISFSLSRWFVFDARSRPIVEESVTTSPEARIHPVHDSESVSMHPSVKRLSPSLMVLNDIV